MPITGRAARARKTAWRASPAGAHDAAIRLAEEEARVKREARALAEGALAICEELGRMAAADRGDARDSVPNIFSPAQRIAWLQGYDSVNVEDRGPWVIR